MKLLCYEKILTRLDTSPRSASLPGRLLHALCRLIAITIQQFMRNRLSLRSSAMTYTLLLSLVPMLAMSTAVVKGLGGGNQLKNLACSYIDNLEKHRGFPLLNLPGSTTPASPAPETEATLTSLLRSVVNKIFAYVDRTNFATLGSFGVGGILVTVLLMFSHVEVAMNAIWKVEGGRSLLRKISDYLTLLFLFPLSVNLTFAASAFLKHPKLALKLDLFIPFTWMQALLFQALPLFFIILSLYALYIFFPCTKVKSVPAMCGALLAALLWFAVQNVYITLQVGVARYNAIYGTFASAPLFLVWLYLGWLFVLLGAQVAWSLQHFSSVCLSEVQDTPAVELAAACDIIDTVYDNFDQERPLTINRLVETLPYDDSLIRRTAAAMEEKGLLHPSAGDDRLLPPTIREHFQREELVDLVLGTATPDTTGGRESARIIATAHDAAGRQPPEVTAA